MERDPRAYLWDVQQAANAIDEFVARRAGSRGRRVARWRVIQFFEKSAAAKDIKDII